MVLPDPAPSGLCPHLSPLLCTHSALDTWHTPRSFLPQALELSSPDPHVAASSPISRSQSTGPLLGMAFSEHPSQGAFSSLLHCSGANTTCGKTQRRRAGLYRPCPVLTSRARTGTSPQADAHKTSCPDDSLGHSWGRDGGDKYLGQSPTPS